MIALLLVLQSVSFIGAIIAAVLALQSIRDSKKASIKCREAAMAARAAASEARSLVNSRLLLTPEMIDAGVEVLQSPDLHNDRERVIWIDAALWRVRNGVRRSQ